MDPFSITAGIAGLLSLTIQVQQIVSKYIGSVKRVAVESQETAAELTALVSVLEQLERFIEQQSHCGDKFDNSSVLYGATKLCHARLASIQSTLHDFMETTKSRSKLWQRSIKWPLAKEEHRQTIRALQDCISIFHFSVSIDGWQLVSTTAKEYACLRANQGRQSAEISKILAAIEKGDKSLQSKFSKLNAIEQGQLTTARREMLDWICSSTDPSGKFNDAIKLREPDTGIWFLNSLDFAQWVTSAGLLWMTGIPGSGKTVLCSTCIEAVQEVCCQSQDRRFAYFFFDFQNARTQNLDIMLRSLIRQLSASELEVPEVLQSMYSTCRDRGQSPTTAQLSSTLISIIKTSSKDSYILIDALDEIPEARRPEVLQFLQRAMAEGLSNLHILATSRDEEDIRATLSNVTDTIILSEKKKVDEDIGIYVRRCLADSGGSLSSLSIPLKTEIESKIGKEAHGMFRLAFCQLEILKRCRKPRDIKDALRRLPQTLDDTYARILAQIDERDYSDALSILQWLAFSERPLAIEEIAEAAIIRPRAEPFDPDDRLLHAREVLRICHSLVMLSTKDRYDRHSSRQVVQFAHFSVQEYLLSGRCGRFAISSSPSHAYIGGSCIVYMLHLEREEAIDIDEFPLFHYAARYWHEHITSTDNAGQELWDLVHRILAPQNFAKRAYRWLQIYEPMMRSSLKWAGDIVNLPGPLYYSAHFGFSDTIRRLLDDGADVNELHRFKATHVSLHARACTALEIAAVRGHTEIVELLLSRGADCTSKSNHGRILQRTLEGHKGRPASRTIDIVLKLLDSGVDMEAAQSNQWDPPLLIAAKAGLMPVIQALVQRGADASLLTEALRIASERGHEAIARYLIDKGASVTDPKIMHAATDGGIEDLFQFVLLRQTDADMQNLLWRYFLGLAASHGYERIIQRLIGLHNQVCPRDLPKAIEDALHQATRGRKSNIVQLLFSLHERDDGITLVSSRAKSLTLHAAIVLRETHIMLLALQAGADANAPAPISRSSQPNGYTPIQSAVYTSFTEGVKMLLQFNARVDGFDREYDNVLKAAARKDNPEIVRLLLKHGLDANLHLDGTKSALLETSDIRIAELLLEAGADINAVYGHSGGFNALQNAALSCNLSMLKFFLQRGADPNKGTPSPIEQALKNRTYVSALIIRVLLEHGATIPPFILHTIGSMTHADAVKVLIAAGADVNAVDEDGKTAIESAWKLGNDHVFRWLIDHGADIDKLYKKYPGARVVTKNPDHHALVPWEIFKKCQITGPLILWLDSEGSEHVELGPESSAA